MGTFGNYPANYTLFNEKLSKHVAIVLKIEGIPYLFGIAEAYSTIRYGDPGIVYGLPGVVYGGLKSVPGILPWMQLDSGLTIQQRIEPESGKGNTGNITVSLVDVGGLVSKIVSPGQFVDEIMAGKLCTLYIGFTETSFPQDYAVIFRGFITQVQCPPGLVKLQISDCSNRARQPLFNIATTTLVNDLDTSNPATGTTVTVNNTGVLHQQILGPDGTFDPTVSTYLEIDSEIFQYGATGILSPTQVLCTRGALGSIIASHSASGSSPGTTVNGSVGFGFNPAGINCIDFALKILLSGWNGPAIQNVPVLSFVYDYNGNFVPNEFLLAASGNDQNDAFFDLGLSVGDAFYVMNSASGNNVSGFITGIQTGVDGRNSIIQTDQTFTLENPTSALVAFRSQYDTFPTTCGLMCAPFEVDVETFQAIQQAYFEVANTSQLRSYYNSPVAGKDLISGDIMLPMGCYSISRYGRISMAFTKPPLPGAGTKLVQIDYTNILDPDKIIITRSTNQRSFYNEISYEYDFDIINQVFSSVQYFVGTESVTEFQTTSVLPIQAISVSSALGGGQIALSRGTAMLNRFQNCLIWIELTVNWSVGSLLEVSDIVLLVDNGTLKIMNFETGLRDIGVQFFEVIDRTFNIVAGNVKLKLLGGLGFDVSSRFALYSPTSVLDSGCTTTKLRLTPSYGQSTVQNEVAKWQPLIGMPIQVHDFAWTVTASSVILSTDPTDVAAIDISPALPFAPTAGMFLDIAPYPTDTNLQEQALLKRLYAHYMPIVAITSGVSQTQFNVAVSGAPLIIVGNPVIVTSDDYSVQSFIDGITVTAVSGTLVTVKTPLGFVPTSAYFVGGIGFRDGTGPYRWN